MKVRILINWRVWAVGGIWSSIHSSLILYMPLILISFTRTKGVRGD